MTSTATQRVGVSGSTACAHSQMRSPSTAATSACSGAGVKTSAPLGPRWASVSSVSRSVDLARLPRSRLIDRRTQLSAALPTPPPTSRLLPPHPADPDLLARALTLAGAGRWGIGGASRGDMG